jgi:hypothetical protein
MLLCFRSQDPQVSLELMLQGPAEEVQEAAQVGVRETAKLVAEWFEHQPEDAYDSLLLFVVPTLLFCK